MRNEAIWAIRDARGLTRDEKTFLFVIESRGEAYASAKTNAQDMALSLKTYYNLRKTLLDKRILIAQQRTGVTTVYTVALEVLKGLVPAGSSSPDKGGLVPATRGASPDVLEGSSTGYQTKKNSKKNQKKNKEEEQRAPVVADAPTVTSSKTEIRERSTSSNSKVDRASSNKRVIEASLSNKKSEREAGREWLETLLSRKKELAHEDKQRARELFEDAGWRPDDIGEKRAAVAVLHSTPQLTAVRNQATTTDVEIW